MNTAVARNSFRRGLELLLASIAQETAAAAQGPYEEGPEQLQLEHGTRITFFDTFLTLLGWTLGLGGDVAEEARIKSETTRFIDYVGVNDTTLVPVLLLEAKAWDKEFIRPTKTFSGTERQLMMAALRHVNQGGDKAEAPVLGAWHDYLAQVRDYVRTSKDRYRHDVPRVVLASGQWLVIFTKPTRTFVDKVVDETDFKLYTSGDFAANADEIYDLLARENLSTITPAFIRPSEIKHYVEPATVGAAFHALLVSYKGKGVSLFVQTPQVLIYPAIILQRIDGALLAVAEGRQSAEMEFDPVAEDGGDRLLTSHLAKVTDQAANLLTACSRELGAALAVSALADFPGFKTPMRTEDDEAVAALGAQAFGDRYVRPIKNAIDEWLIVTGDTPHYLLHQPRLACQFHAWAHCRVSGYETGISAVSAPLTEPPRAFFVDGSPYHCAHQTVIDRRRTQCPIAPLDQRTCCSACAFQDICWDEQSFAGLPCGKD